jgi:prepilin-type N-terminal cleavage/methylation domain-containing protein
MNRRGFSLLESMLAVLVLSAIAVVAMRAAGTSARTQLSLAEVQLASRLADSLLAEIMTREYPKVIAVTTATTRGSFRKVSDFAGFDESPPKLRSGGVLTFSGGASGLGSNWRRTATLEFVDPANPTLVVGSDRGLLRITVTVSRGGVLLSRRVGYRAWDS